VQPGKGGQRVPPQASEEVKR